MAAIDLAVPGVEPRSPAWDRANADLYNAVGLEPGWSQRLDQELQRRRLAFRVRTPSDGPTAA
ncbi:MAG: hypothetical protein ACHQAY_27640 [Hyphomicrobiales bacterium]